MKNIIANLVCIFISFYCSGQNLPKEYTEQIKRADSLFVTNNYIESANTFSLAFKTLGWKGLGEDRYKAARSWALAGNSDSALFNLERIANALYFSDYQQVFSDSAFLSLHNDMRWLPLMELIKNNQKKGELNPNLSLTEELEIIYSDDQKYRKMLDTIPPESEARNAVFKLMGEKDHYNLQKIEKILDTYGWLGEDTIGIHGNSALFLVIQHADLKTQEKYFPMMQKAVNIGKLKKSSFALLQDRMNLRHGKKQIYGSQIDRDEQAKIYYVSPLEDPDNVDKRRAEVGLQPLKDYVKMWDIDWDIEQYKKNLPAIEMKEKLKNKYYK
jgi:hypothetical protein